MLNNIDFIYEYSDLNLFQIRTKILTGKYSGIILEFGSSVLAQDGDKNTFTFDYTIYELPDQFHYSTLKENKEFNEFLGQLLVDIIATKRNDPEEKEKLDEAACYIGKQYSNIKINEKFYSLEVLKARKQPTAQGLTEF